ncbi:WD repeat-containing protein 64 [Biomphalaria glabrata]|uniref:WD repeat-containing protein 64-like isoform X2 n=1 Tax=Biomphalaria glabrata TaxID=6526 RepID=A0A9W3A0B3_BIOGL|nr:WD repeat-containing protein 64-like isoform X2 [Biomphalaria glabrata]
MTSGRIHDDVVDGDRPFTDRTFQARVKQFNLFIQSLTHQFDQSVEEESRQWINETYRFDQFCARLKDLFGSDLQKHDLRTLYKKISNNPGARVDWSEIFGFNSASMTTEGSVGDDISVFQVSARRKVGEAAGDKLRRDTIQQIKYIPYLDSYLSCSLKGTLAVWSNQLRLQSCLDIHEPVWTTSCDYLPALRRVLCSTERSLLLWDNRANGNAQSLFMIKPLEDSPQSITIIPSTEDVLEDRVLYGDDQGYVSLLTILPQDLAIKHSKDRKTDVSESQTIDPKNLTKEIIRRQVHSDSIIKVKYFPTLKSLGSCSASSSTSFALESVDRIFYQNKEPRCVSIRKGVNCFDLCVRANIIATGGVDKIIRLWHPHIFSRPSGKLIGHLFTISDIAINEADQHIISLSTARVFRIWDIHTLTCLQVFTDNEERSGDRRIYSITYDNKNERLLSGSSVVDSWPLARTIKDSPPVPLSHDRPIVQMLINKEANQIVSVCSHPIIKVWEIETGHLTYSINDPHGPNMEVTCIALDRTFSKLVTGAYDGSLKIWDFGSGQMVKSRMTMTSYGLSELSLTSIVCTRKRNENLILASTVSKILIYLDSTESTRIILIQELSHLLELPKDMDYAGSNISDGYYQISRTELRAERSFGQQTLLSIPSDLTSLEEEKETDEEPLQDTHSAIGTTKRINTQFPVTKLLPDIETSQLPSTSCHVTCMTLIMFDLIATGYSNGQITIWDAERLVMKSKLTLPSHASQSNEQVNEIIVMIFKPKYLRRSTAQQTASHLSASLVGHRARHRRTGQTVLPDLDQLSSQTAANTITVNQPLNESRVEKQSVHKLSQELENKELEMKFTDSKEKSKLSDTKSESPGAASSVSSMSSPVMNISFQSVQDPIIVSAHQSSVLRFWDMSGELLLSFESVEPKAKIPVTALCFNTYTQYVYTGNTKGYVTVWDVKQFLQDPHQQDSHSVKQTLYWKGHLNKINNIVIIEAANLLLTTSVDGSIRVWLATNGAFIGFFGQVKPLYVPPLEKLQKNIILPFDINEGPTLTAEKTKTAPKIKIRNKFEFPLIFEPARWEQFRRSAYNKAREDNQNNMEEKKFFGALIKPKAYNSHLESYITADQKAGAVFRSLPVYTVPEPDDAKQMASTFHQFQDHVALLGTNQILTKSNKRKAKDGRNSFLPKLSSLQS